MADSTANSTGESTLSNSQTQDTTIPSAASPPTSSPPHLSTDPNTMAGKSSDTLVISQDADRDLDIDAEINPKPSPSQPTQTQPNRLSSGALDDSANLPPVTAIETNGTLAHPTVIEPRIPQKRDASLREFLSKMDDQYTPLIPDAVTDYYLTLAGLPPPPQTDRRLARLLALATQKFVADIAADAYQYSRIRSTNTTSNNPLTGLGGAAGFGTMATAPGGDGEGGGGGAGKKGKDAAKTAPLGGPRAGYGGGGTGAAQGRTVLTMEDLGMAVGEYGVNVKRGEFYR